MAQPLTAIGSKPLPQDTHSCWSCGSMRAARFCASCGKVQPPAPVDYFTFFGLRPKLNLDIPALERDFYELSRRLHPDLNARAGSQEQEWSLEQSSLLNDAYRTLRDPIKRTEYLLKLEGVELEEQSKSATEKARATGEIKKQLVSPEFLEEIFDDRMELEEARKRAEVLSKLDRGSRDPNLVDEIDGLRSRFEGRHEKLLGELRQQWTNWDRLIDRGQDAAESERTEVRDKMLETLNHGKYIRNLLEDASTALGMLALGM